MSVSLNLPGGILALATQTDEEGFLTDPSDWSEALAVELASAENINLTDAHLEIVHLAREFYFEFGFSPSSRPLGKYVATHLDVGKARSIYLMQLFPGSPAKLVSKIGGLPKPKNCL
ncbi:MAG: TusE/DsrC/DsvC family sulfur relay protein [bacterium]